MNTPFYWFIYSLLNIHKIIELFPNYLEIRMSLLSELASIMTISLSPTIEKEKEKIIFIYSI